MTVCHCPTCDAEGGLQPNGRPKGRSFSANHYKIHLLRISRENSDQQNAGIEEAGSTLFTSTLLDDGPDLETLPSKLWVSRKAFQKERAPYILPMAQEDSSVSVDAAVNGIRRLVVSYNETPSHASDFKDITDKLDNLTLADPPTTASHANDLADQFENLALADKSISSTPASGHRHPGMSKKDRSQHTINALAVLTSIQQELRKCSNALSTTSPPNSTISDTVAVLARARQGIHRIKRSTTDILNLKQQVIEQINNIDSRIVELESLSSHVGPIEYSTGKLLVATRCRLALITSLRSSFHDVHSSL